MKGLTIYQPWASWIIWGWKKIETRRHVKFRCLKGQRIFIHAGKKYDVWAYDEAKEFLSEERREFHLDIIRQGEQELYYPAGAILGTTLVHEARELLIKDSTDALIECGFTKRHGLFMRELDSFPEPIYVPGKQGIWEYTIPEPGNYWEGH